MGSFRSFHGGRIMKTRLHRSIKTIIIAAGIFFTSSLLWAETVEISTAEITMRDLDLLHPGGGAPKTALVTPTGSVALSSTVDPAIWGKSSGWTVTVSSGRTVQGSDYGILFNGAKDGSSGDLAGTLINGGNISASGGQWIFGVETGAGSAITNQSGATISGTAATKYGLGIYADEGSTISNAGSISGSATTENGIGIWAEKNSIITNQAGAIISGTAASNGRGIYGKSGITVDNRGAISGSGSTGGGYGIYGTGGGWTITNHEGATISASGTASLFGPVHGITLLSNPANTITNNGTITVTCSGGPCGGITGSSNTTNTGTIKVTRTGGSGGLATIGLDVSGTITNSGRIEVKNESASGSATGISAKLPDSTLTNKSGGIISATAATSSSATAVQIVKGTVINEEGASITSSGKGVILGDSILKNATSLTNYGAISGATGVHAPGGNATIDNYGAITGTGGAAIQLDGDNNTLVLHDLPTVVVTGAIVATGNNNTLELADTGSLLSNITGSWALAKTGIGAWTLSGDSTYAGETMVNAGTLHVNGSIMSPVTVSEAGTLAGAGSVGSVVNSGMIAPGNSIGTLTINGNYTHNAGAVYEVEVNAAGQSDRLVVSGTATINGGTVSVLAGSGTYNPSTTYTILSAGSVNGNFTAVTSNLAFLTPSLSYDPANVYLLLSSNGTNFADAARTRSQRSVASAFDRISSSATGDMDTVLTGLSGLSAPGARSAFDQTGGLVHAALAEGSLRAFNLYLDTVSDRIDRPRSSSPLFASLTGVAAGIPPSRGFWMKGYGGAGDRSGDDISSRYDYKAGGIAFGYDRMAGDCLFGISAGYSKTRLSMDRLDEAGHINLYQTALYGSYRSAPWYLNGIIAYGYNRYDTSRDIAFGSIARTADADYDGHTVSLYTEAGYHFKTSRNFTITPLASLQATFLNREGFTEKDAAALDLDVDREHTQSLLGSLGFMLKKEYGAFVPELRVRWLHEFLDNDYIVDGSFVGSPTAAFTIKTDKASRDRVAAGLGITWAAGTNLSLALAYDTTLSEGWTSHTASLGLSYRW